MKNRPYFLVLGSMLLLSACSGVYIGVPIGPVSVGTTVGKDGPKSVSAGVGAGPAGVSASVPVKKEEKAFEDSPEEYDLDEQDGQGRNGDKQNN